MSADMHPTATAEPGRPPNAKKPKARPHRDWRDKPCFPGRTLPPSTGPYAVGAMEIEVPVVNKPQPNGEGHESERLHRLETVLMNVYYPRSSSEHDHERKSRQLWLNRPRLETAEAYGQHWAPASDQQSGGPDVKQEAGERPEGGAGMPTYPLILFSHGLGGTPTMYSAICGEFDSRDFVVCAVEHRDGSGSRSFINHSHPEAAERSHATVDWMLPAYNPHDTNPNNPDGPERELRDAQLALRLAEIEDAYRIMCRIAEGRGQEVADQNLRRKGHAGSSSLGLDGIDWAKWKDRLDVEHVTACGHSFGAATVVDVLRKHDRFPFISQGIVFDAWAGGIKPRNESEPADRICVPFLSISSEAFAYWRHNYDLVQSLVQETMSEPVPSPAWRITLRGTIHISSTDFALLYPHLSSLAMKMTANPRRALDLHVSASLKFLSKVLPEHIALNVYVPNQESLLDSEVSRLEDVPAPQIRAPDPQWKGARLKLNHERQYRLTPKLVRKIKDNRGRPAGESKAGDEHWLHAKPSAELLEQYKRRRQQAVAHSKCGVNELAVRPSDSLSAGSIRSYEPSSRSEATAATEQSSIAASNPPQKGSVSQHP